MINRHIKVSKIGEIIQAETERNREKERGRKKEKDKVWKEERERVMGTETEKETECKRFTEICIYKFNTV